MSNIFDGFFLWSFLWSQNIFKKASGYISSWIEISHKVGLALSAILRSSDSKANLLRLFPYDLFDQIFENKINKKKLVFE
jgi:hypothetical protein